MDNAKLYNELLSKKNSGHNLNFDSITYDELYQLWGEENCPDSVIGSLFNVPQEKVRKKRYEYDIKMGTVKSNELHKMITTEIPQDLLLIYNTNDSDKVESVIKELQDLSEQEINSVINYLIKNNSKVKSMAQDSKRLKLLFGKFK